MAIRTDDIVHRLQRLLPPESSMGWDYASDVLHINTRLNGNTLPRTATRIDLEDCAPLISYIVEEAWRFTGRMIPHEVRSMGMGSPVYGSIPDTPLKKVIPIYTDKKMSNDFIDWLLKEKEQNKEKTP